MRHFTEQEINFDDMPSYEMRDAEIDERREMSAIERIEALSESDDEGAALELLYTAQEHMLTAIEALRKYVEVTGDRHTEAYILDHLVIMTTANHGFMSRNANIEQLIANVERGEDY